MNSELRSKIITNLTDADCDIVLAERYADSKSTKEKDDILKNHRKRLPDDLHKCRNG